MISKPRGAWGKWGGPSAKWGCIELILTERGLQKRNNQREIYQRGGCPKKWRNYACFAPVDGKAPYAGGPFGGRAKPGLRGYEGFMGGPVQVGKFQKELETKNWARL